MNRNTLRAMGAGVAITLTLLIAGCSSGQAGTPAVGTVPVTVSTTVPQSPEVTTPPVTTSRPITTPPRSSSPVIEEPPVTIITTVEPAGQGATISIDTSDGYILLTCSEVIQYIAQLDCTPDGYQRVWDEIARLNPTGFDAYVYSGKLGAFSDAGDDIKVEDLVYVGFSACVNSILEPDDASAFAEFHVGLDEFYDGFTTDDTIPAFDTALELLCVE